MRWLLIPTILAVASATPALAQTYPPYRPPYAAYPGGTAAAIADQHRYENERLRAQAQASAALARQQQAEARLRRLEIEAARQPTLPAQAAPRALYATEQEQALRQSATERRQDAAQGYGQIDDWLDRNP